MIIKCESNFVFSVGGLRWGIFKALFIFLMEEELMKSSKLLSRDKPITRSDWDWQNHLNTKMLRPNQAWWKIFQMGHFRE